MKTDVVSISKITVVPVENLPDGEYNGIWGGYEVNVTIKGENYKLETSVGIRTFNAPCVVKVINGEISIDV